MYKSDGLVDEPGLGEIFDPKYSKFHRTATVAR
jgi:hypothetical protein